MDRRESAAARCHIYGQAPCTLPELYATWELRKTWVSLRLILGVIIALVNGHRADKSVMPCLQRLFGRLVYGLQPVPDDVASGQMLSLKAAGLTTKIKLLDRVTYEEKNTLRFVDSLLPGARQ